MRSDDPPGAPGAPGGPAAPRGTSRASQMAPNGARARGNPPPSNTTSNTTSSTMSSYRLTSRLTLCSTFRLTVGWMLWRAFCLALHVPPGLPPGDTRPAGRHRRVLRYVGPAPAPQTGCESSFRNTVLYRAFGVQRSYFWLPAEPCNALSERRRGGGVAGKPPGRNSAGIPRS